MRLGCVAAEFGGCERRPVLQQRIVAQHLEHLLGVGLPVGGTVQVSTGLEARGQAVYQRTLDQAALVVPLLVPRIREEQVDGVQAAGRSRRVPGRQHRVHDFNRVVRDDADVVQAELADLFEQRADAGLVHLAAQEVGFGHQAGNMGGRVAHAKADFQHQRALRSLRPAAERCRPAKLWVDGGQRRNRGLEGYDEARTELVNSARLACGRPAGAAHEAANRPVVGLLRRAAVGQIWA